MKRLTASKRAPRWLLGALVLSGSAALVGYGSTSWGAAFGAPAEGERLSRMQRSSRFHEGVFTNTHPTTVMRGGTLQSTKDFLFNDAETTPRNPPPVAEDTAQRLAAPPVTGLRLTWFGHSTVLVEIDGLRLLTDPVWSERVSPSSLVGPKRFHSPPLPLSAIGRIDAVLISHDHYDHLDMDTVRELAARELPFLMPLGVGAHLERWGVERARIREFDWWGGEDLGRGVRVVATPAQHFSGRGLLDRNRTLWASFSILGPRHRVFFSGDTGLTDELEEVGRRFGPFDVALFEIGAYNDAWGDIHLGPNKALEAFRMVNARALLPIHWSTYNLALHAWSEPAETLWTKARESGVRLCSPLIGQVFEPDTETPSSPWWRGRQRE